MRGGLKRPHRDPKDFTYSSADRTIPGKRDANDRIRGRRPLEVEPRGLVAKPDRELEVAGARWNPPPDDTIFAAAFGADEAKGVIANLETDPLKIGTVRLEWASVDAD